VKSVQWLQIYETGKFRVVNERVMEYWIIKEFDKILGRASEKVAVMTAIEIFQ